MNRGVDSGGSWLYVMTFLLLRCREYHREVEDLYLKAVQSSPQEIDADVQVDISIKA